MIVRALLLTVMVAVELLPAKDAAAVPSPNCSVPALTMVPPV